jgi:cyclomaltodextrinase
VIADPAEAPPTAGTLPGWVEGRTLYHLHSLGASGVHPPRPGSPTGRGLAPLEGWLDHVAGLGCGGVLLTPIGVSSTHGYDVVDPFHLDGRLGSDADFDRFVAAAHDRDLRVVLDGVFNHVGRAFPEFEAVLGEGSSSRSAAWFRPDPAGPGGYHCFEGHPELVSLNHRSPDVLAWAAGVARSWLDRGADGWRLDAAYAILPGFLAQLTSTVRRDHPDALLVGEVIHGDYGAFAAATGLAGVTQYELHKAIWSSLHDGNFFELAWALRRHNDIVEVSTPLTFVGNHDVTRVASRIPPDLLPLAAGLLLTLPGIPCVYYGDELGWTGIKEDRSGGDDAIRPAIPASADVGLLGEAYRCLIGLRRSCPWLTRERVEVAELTNRRMSYIVAGRLWVGLDVDLGRPDPPPGHPAVLEYPGLTIGRG